MPDLTMLCQTLMHVKNLHWIIVEDCNRTSDWIGVMLIRSGILHTHMAQVKTAIELRSGVRGASQRNAALEWITEHATEGVIYFADDDNSYDIQLFEELRTIKKVGILPTGNLQYTGISSPVVENGKVTGFVDVWHGGRKFPVEMASIGINIAFYKDRESPIFNYSKPGYLETRFLESLKLSMQDLEPKANNCTQIYVWHTQTIKLEKIDRKYTNSAKYKNTNIPKLMENVVFNR